MVDGNAVSDADVPFDLAHCIALAGCSFDAYTDPESRPAFAERSANGTTTLYIDRDFVHKNFQAILQIRVIGASRLPARDVPIRH